MSDTQPLVGAGGASLGALTSIGSDLSVSVSFQVATELLAAAHETDMKDDELVGMVLGVAIALSALNKMLEYVRKERIESQLRKQTCSPSETIKIKQQMDSERSLLDFALLFTRIATRIAFAVTVQLVASSARATQNSRGARILTLLGLCVFFVYVESSAEQRIF
jgi:hypothetical protein